MGIYGAWTLLSSIFVCWPIAYFWNKITIKGHCLDEFNVWFANAGMNILTDITIVVLPIRPIQHLNLPRRQKRLLIVVFGLAGLYVTTFRKGLSMIARSAANACPSVCIVSILRLQSLVQISRSKDQSWDNGPAATWSSVEANVGIICASLPPLRPLISRIAPRIFPGTAYASPGYGYGSKTTRGEPNGRHHVPLSSASRQNAQFAPSHSKSKSRSGNRSGNHSGSNESEEEMIGLKHMGAGVAIGEPPVYSPRRVGVQPATVVATSPPISRSQSFATSPVERPGRAFHKPIPRDEMRGIVTPPGRSRRNSFDRWEQRPPEGNEIQVVTSMQQSVETQDPGRTWYDGAPHVVPSGWEMRH